LKVSTDVLLHFVQLMAAEGQSDRTASEVCKAMFICLYVQSYVVKFLHVKKLAQRGDGYCVSTEETAVQKTIMFQMALNRCQTMK